MINRVRGYLSSALALTLISSIPVISPVAQAADCAPTYGTLSAPTRYAIFNSGAACTWRVPAGVTNISYLVVGGGGGGGGARPAASAPNLGGGGGGAGGVVLASTLNVNAGSVITLTVGSGGSGGAAGVNGSAGSASSFTYATSTITANGGGGGGGSNGAHEQANLSGDGGSNSSYQGGSNDWDGGGGGAGSASAGSNGIDIGGQGGTGGAGGTGTLNTILGNNLYYGGGGGGGGTPATNSNETNGYGGTGGSSVGGNGGGGPGTLPTAGAANTGSGGGGGGWRFTSSYADRAGASGASGRIIFTFSKSPASISAISISSNAGADNFYKIGDVISVTITASESITVGNTPRIPVLGLTSKFFTYVSGSGTTSLIFSYTVVTSDSASAGVGITANTLNLNGGSMTDAAGVDLALSHSALPQSTSHRVDGILPTLVGVTQSQSVPENETRTITLTTSESATFRVVTSGDSAYFVLNANAATLSLTPRDFENKLDSGADNGYYIGITLTDLAGNATGSFNFNFTVTDVVEAASLGSPSFSSTPMKGVVTTITITSDVAGKANFYWNGKKIPGCIAKSTTGASPNNIAQCSWKPATTGLSVIYARIVPTSSSYSAASSLSIAVRPIKRSGLR